MTETYVKECEAELAAIVKRLQEELQTVRSNHPSLGLVGDIIASYYDQQLPLKQLGSLSIRFPRDVEINVWDKGAVGAVIKAIEASKMGFGVSSDGNVVRASLPSLTDERRQEFMKLVKKIAEASRIQMRNRRDDAIKKVKAGEDEGGLNEDQAFKAKESIQKAVDDANARIELLLGAKLKELNE